MVANVPLVIETNILLAVGGLAVLQLLTFFGVIYSLRKAAVERKKINRETFGLLKKVEGLLARKQTKLMKEYDRLLEQMTLQVPVIIAQQAGHEILETEKHILTRLAELEPELGQDEIALQKMETIIKCMEGLESSVINATSRAVESVLIENRKQLLCDEANEEIEAA